MISLIETGTARSSYRSEPTTAIFVVLKECNYLWFKYIYSPRLGCMYLHYAMCLASLTKSSRGREAISSKPSKRASWLNEPMINLRSSVRNKHHFKIAWRSKFVLIQNWFTRVAADLQEATTEAISAVTAQYTKPSPQKMESCYIYRGRIYVYV